MNRKALIFASESGFGQLIGQVLDDFGGYHARVGSLDSLAAHADHLQSADLGIIDADIGPEDMSAFIRNLRENSPNLQLILITSEKNPYDASLEGLGVDHVLPTPFYLPDLISVLHKLNESRPKGVEGKLENLPHRIEVETKFEESPPLGWRKDKALAAQQLTQLSLETSSEAALILRDGQLWASAGELSQPAVEELLASLTHYWQQESAVDFARFVNLISTGEDYMLYAKQLEENFALAMVFNAKMPFSKMRSKIDEMAQAIETPSIGKISERGNEKIIRQGGQVGSPGIARQTGQELSSSAIPIQDFGSPKSPQGVIFESSLDRLIPRQEGLSLQTSLHARELLYSYALIPRLPEHQLDGDLAYKLSKWMPQLCLAYAWRLEYLSVQVQALQWTASVSTDTSPEVLVHKMEQQLSQRIFRTFPLLTQDNPSGEFWAPGALIFNGEQASPEAISDYIQETRARQGIPGNR